jgi:hypothetical protein
MTRIAFLSLGAGLSHRKIGRNGEQKPSSPCPQAGFSCLKPQVTLTILRGFLVYINNNCWNKAYVFGMGANFDIEAVTGKQGAAE